MVKMSLGDKKIKGSGKFSFHTFKNQAEYDKARDKVEAMYAKHEATKLYHGQTWLNTNDKTYRVYDCDLLKWCMYSETDNLKLKKLLEPFLLIERNGI